MCKCRRARIKGPAGRIWPAGRSVTVSGICLMSVSCKIMHSFCPCKQDSKRSSFGRRVKAALVAQQTETNKTQYPKIETAILILHNNYPFDMFAKSNLCLDYFLSSMGILFRTFTPSYIQDNCPLFVLTLSR